MRAFKGKITFSDFSLIFHSAFFWYFIHFFSDILSLIKAWLLFLLIFYILILQTSIAFWCYGFVCAQATAIWKHFQFARKRKPILCYYWGMFGLLCQYCSVFLHNNMKVFLYLKLNYVKFFVFKNDYWYWHYHFITTANFSPKIVWAKNSSKN